MIVFKQLGNLGRLGNQMFQIAATLAHAKRMQVPARFPKWKYTDYFERTIDDTLSDKYDCRFEGVLHDIYTDGNYHYTPIPQITSNLILEGFFQSEKYFADYKDCVLGHFTPSHEFFKTVRAAGGSILNLNNITAIHVRRGDYVRHENFDVLPMDYYASAMHRMLLEKQGAVNFYIFSDDIKWCKENFGDEPYIYYSEGNNEIIDMYLMAMCRHHIIANSSFSWWGAYLKQIFFQPAEVASSMTIAPEPWFNKRDISQDIYCADWYHVQVTEDKKA